MPENKIGQIPDFTPDDGGQEESQEEVKQDLGNGEPESLKKETSTEPPAESEESEQKPADRVKAPLDDNTSVIPEEVLNKAVTKATEGLRNEVVKLKRELATARGADRTTIQSKIEKTQEAIEDLKDVHPDDVNLIERVLRSKGYIKKEDSEKMYYETVKKEEINKFLDKFPEYKPENDPDDVNWNTLKTQLESWYRMPSDPRLVSEVLLKAHRDIAKAPSDRVVVEAKKQQVKVASSGSSGIQRSSPQPNNPRLSSLLRTHMHGWSEEEIKNLEKKLPE